MSKSYPHLRTSFPVHPSHFRSSSCCMNLSPFMQHASSPTPPAPTAIIARLQHNHNMRTVISFALGVIWGSSWAVFLHMTTVGRWLRLWRTWLTVVIGVGGCLAIVGARHSWRSAATALTIFAGAGAPIVTASILEEFKRDID